MITRRYQVGVTHEPPQQLGWLRSLISRAVGAVQFRIPDFNECRDSMDDMEFGGPWCRDCGSDELRCRCLPGSE